MVIPHPDRTLPPAMLAEMKTALEGSSLRAVLARGYCVAEKDGIVVRIPWMP